MPASRDPRASALNLITPISSRGRLWLRFLFWASTVLPLPRFTVLRLRLIHYARWTVLGRSRPHLFFERNVQTSAPQLAGGAGGFEGGNGRDDFFADDLQPLDIVDLRDIADHGLDAHAGQPP